MALFQQKTIEQFKAEHLKDEKAIKKAFDIFKTKFQDPKRQAEILKMIEIEYQGEFLDDLFVSTLGHIKRPDAGYNLMREQHGTTAERADGVFVKPTQQDYVFGVIELKDKKTKNLQKIEEQAFGYHVQHPNSRYIITSNYQYLRIYIDTNEEFEEFDLFKMDYERFRLMYLYLHRDNLLHGLPSKIREASIVKEKEITKKFYDDYKLFRNVLLKEILAKNSKKYDKQLLVKKTQKLLDRLLFIFFSEDRGLIKAKTSIAILDDWTNRTKENKHIPLYDYFKSYFGYLNKGFTSEHYGKVHAYNGGLFAPDEILDNLNIFDNILEVHVRIIEFYNFVSELNANILGHIFEQSLNDMEEVTAIINGIDFDKKKTKRKKDGVFYTPTYITKYIVAHTVGALCREKETELGLNDEKRLTLKGVETYREWLLTLTVIDPACGSGAFLNEVLDFFIAEHRHIDELEANVKGTLIDFKDYSDQILSNNIFGVDINEESVEIAQLSLWLHTAKVGRKLVTLHKNIQCGNSLISDPKVAGDKAFDWKKAFPTVFENGGFDVVLGNPPYGAELSEKEYLKKKYPNTSFGQIDSYKYFVELGTIILSKKGTLGFIMPDSYLEKDYFKDLRTLCCETFKRVRNIKLGDNVFSDVNLPTAIFIGQSSSEKKFEYKDIANSKNEIDKIRELTDINGFIYQIPDYSKTFVAKLELIKRNGCINLIEAYEQVMGVKVYQVGKGKPKQTNFEIENNIFISKTQNEKFNYPFISQGIQRYSYEPTGEYIQYGECLAEPRKLEYFKGEKLIIREIVNPSIYATYISYPAVVKNIAAVVIAKSEEYNLKYLLALLNSKLLTYYIFEESAKSSNKTYPSFTSNIVKNIPIKAISKKAQQPFIDKAETMLKNQKEVQDLNKKFEKRLNGDFKGVKMNKIMEQWHSLDFYDFKKEVEKQTRPMLPPEKTEWIEVLEDFQTKANVLLKTIKQTDAAIDKAVYALYELNAAEIEIIEKQ